jgi:hypothetical protein
MNELIQQLVAQIGVSQAQAEGGLGLLLKVAQEKLSSGDFAEVSQAIPEATTLLGAAPQGGGSLLGGLAAALGGSRAGTLAELAAGFGKLGVNADTARRFGPVVLAYLQKNGSTQALDIVKKLLA